MTRLGVGIGGGAVTELTSGQEPGLQLVAPDSGAHHPIHVDPICSPRLVEACP